jgi:hypothetical protein
MALVMVGEDIASVKALTEASIQLARQEEFLLQPQRQRFAKRTVAGGSIGEISFEQPFELGQGLFVEADVVQVVCLDASLGQTVFDSFSRKTMIVFDPAEALLLGRGDDLAIDDQRGGRVVIEGRDAEDGGHATVLREEAGPGRTGW